ncbi:two-component system LytT family sensor kinase [Thermodesulfitimonas autotrophica]|uniref:histidine kinase n=1 Tax=Thermodesulfitimonas autotrophica TaxID=1894989 RepID=A0A3N5AZR3_9THEO|nr:histidine kinase [Thermodesulfitimonas autotrophica]RPF42678.1 two-component system LytT family sensor kinase [Thermodesulfitimonas autotrophica]
MVRFLKEAAADTATKMVLLQFLLLGLVVAVWPHFWLAALVLAGVNSLTFFFLRQSEARQRATLRMDSQTIDPTLKIADAALPYMRHGLNEETAHKIAEIIQRIGDVPAVAITDRERILAFLGPGCERHPPGGGIVTHATKQVILTGEIKIVERRADFQCPVKDCQCPLGAVVIVPLKCRDEVVGTLKLYRTEEGPLPQITINLAIGIAQLLGVQMELAELERQSQLAMKAELEALRAQINPHFLFNTLNTIVMFSRTNPETARRLLIRLASFFRHALKSTGHFTTLREEWDCVNTYLVLEKARFREKLRIVRSVDKSLFDYQIPILTLQPLVENAIKHGIMPKVDPGTVRIAVRRVGDEMAVEIADDGVGIPPEILPKIFTPGFGSGSGVGLSNVNERLKGLFGENYGLQVTSEPNKGTVVQFRIPLTKQLGESKEGGALEAKSVNR